MRSWGGAQISGNYTRRRGQALRLPRGDPCLLELGQLAKERHQLRAFVEHRIGPLRQTVLPHRIGGMVGQDKQALAGRSIAAKRQQSQAIARPQFGLKQEDIPALGIGLQPLPRLLLRGRAAHAASQLQIVQTGAQRLLQLNTAVNNEHPKDQDLPLLVKFI